MKKFVVMFAIITLVFSPVTPGHAVESVFTGADGEWTTPGSWSNGVPGAGDDAVINASVQTISGGSGTASVLSAVFNNNTLWDSAWNGLTLEVGGGAGMATFNDNSLNRGKINGNATFNDNSFSSWGTINGNATFNDNSRNDVSTINGNATFNGSSYDVQSTINGDMYIKSNWWSGVAGAPTGNELVIAAGREWGSAVTGRVYNSNLIPVEITQYTFNDGRLHRHGTLNGNVVFNLTDPDVGDQAGTINAGDTGTVSGNFRTSSGITFLSGTVSSNINGTGGVTKKGAGTVTMSGTSTYTGLTVLTEGVLSVSMIGDGGVAGNIGQATNAAENLVLRGGTLRYTGATASTDRNFTVDDHRQSTIEVTGAASTLTMSGSSPLTNGSLTKTGAGTLLLSGTHRYTGGTDVTAGTLRLDGSLASQTVVQTAGTLSGSGTTRNLTIANGGTLSPGSGPGTLTTSGDATYAGGGTYTWEINDAGGVKGTNWDLHDITGDLTITADSGTPFTIAITSLNGAVAGEAANFDKYNNYEWVIASTVTGITGFATSAFTLDLSAFQNAVAGVFGISLSVNGQDLLLTYTAPPPPSPDPIYWKGDTNGAWNEYTGGATNWTSDPEGNVDAGALPDATSNVHFYATGGANLATKLGGNFSVKGVTMESTAVNAVVIGDGIEAFGLTIGADGIVLGNGSGPLTINSDVTLGSAQTWTNGNASGGNQLIVNGNITNGGFTLTVGGTGDTTLSGAISGGGGLTKTDDGTLELNGNTANTYTGQTSVNGGTLNLNKTGVNAIAGNLSVSGTGTVSLLQSDQITDTSSVVVSGGTLDMRTSGDTVAGVQLIDGIIAGTTGVLTSTSDFDMQSGLVSAILGGNVGLTKTGNGTVTLSGANTYTGATTISAGTLQAGNNSALGTGNVTNNATLDLGSTTLAIGGNYTQAATATLKLTISGATTCGNSVVAGAATVAAGSGVHVTVPSGTSIAPGTQFTILTDNNAAAAIGLPVVTSNTRRYTFAVSVDGAAGALLLTSANGTYAAPVGASGNASAVGDVLGGITDPSGDMNNVLDQLGMMSDQAYENALETMSPDVSGGSVLGSQAMMGQFLGSVGQRLGFARNGLVVGGLATGDMFQGSGFWMQGLGSHAKQGARKGIEGFNMNTFGTALGADRLIAKHLRAGVAGGYSFAKAKSKLPGSPSSDMNSFQATVYGSYDSVDLCRARLDRMESKDRRILTRDGAWYVDGMAGFGANTYNDRRTISLGTSQRVAKAKHYGQQYATKWEAGYMMMTPKTKALEITPFASLEYSYLYMNKYKERGADALNLTVAGEGYHTLEQGLGMKFAYPLVSKKRGTFVPAAKAAWLYDYLADKFETTSSFAGGGTSFTSSGAKPARNGALFGAELAYLNKGNMTLTANYDCTLRDQYRNHTYYLTARFDF